ncbi:aspartyl-phosphate phosphatase Spo0E family protein [Aneurinibacillus thermoaerophilus]|nr:aspartyl-phosphate phosphatase Spo0E family protein [Aneurinibacillus thermoaerophilus]
MEQKRKEMIDVAKMNGFDLQHPAVLKVSQELDKLLVTAMKKQMQERRIAG